MITNNSLDIFNESNKNMTRPLFFKISIKLSLVPYMGLWLFQLPYITCIIPTNKIYSTFISAFGFLTYSYPLSTILYVVELISDTPDKFILIKLQNIQVIIKMPDVNDILPIKLKYNDKLKIMGTDLPGIKTECWILHNDLLCAKLLNKTSQYYVSLTNKTITLES
jgi:hypothetical protein